MRGQEMAQGEIVIDENLCKGCDLCSYYCTRGCISPPSGRLSPLGYPLPEFSKPERCNACGICAWMCPDFAIQVYKLVEAVQ